MAYRLGFILKEKDVQDFLDLKLSAVMNFYKRETRQSKAVTKIRQMKKKKAEEILSKVNTGNYIFAHHKDKLVGYMRVDLHKGEFKVLEISVKPYHRLRTGNFPGASSILWLYAKELAFKNKAKEFGYGKTRTGPEVLKSRKRK